MFKGFIGFLAPKPTFIEARSKDGKVWEKKVVITPYCMVFLEQLILMLSSSLPSNRSVNITSVP
jgi:hypothetical protein